VSSRVSIIKSGIQLEAKKHGRPSQKWNKGTDETGGIMIESRVQNIASIKAGGFWRSKRKDTRSHQ
jgi:hypothetical protein